MLQFSVRKDVKWVLRDKGGFVYFPEDGRIEVLNSTATKIIKLLLAGLSVETIIEQLSSTYSEVPRDQLEADVQDFIQALESRGLLVKKPVC